MKGFVVRGKAARGRTDFTIGKNNERKAGTWYLR